MAGKKPNWNRCVLSLVPDRDGSMVDFSPYGNHASQATAANQPTLVNDGVNINKSLSFDGAASPNNDYLVVPDHTSLQLTGSYSVAALIKISSFAAVNLIWEKYSSNTDRYQWLFSGAQPGKIGMANNNNSIFYSTDLFQLNTWNIIGFTFNGTTVTHYLNGSPNGTDAMIPSGGAIGADLRIGSRYNDTWGMNGRLQYLFAFNYALDADEHIYMNKYLPTWLPRGSK